MLELQGRRKLRRLIYSKLSIVVLLLVLVFLGRSVWGVYQKNELAQYHKKQSLQELQELQQQKSSLMADVSRLETSRGVEEEIRKNFPVAKEGESVITVVEPKVVETSATESTSEPQDFWSKIKNVLFRD